jgi:hypothetical protein
MTSIFGYRSQNTFIDGIRTDKIDSKDDTAEIDIGKNEIDFVADSVLINGLPIPSLEGFVKNPMINDLDCGNKNITNLKSLNISSLGFGAAATIKGSFTQLKLESELFAAVSRDCITSSGVKLNQFISIDNSSSRSIEGVQSNVSSINVKATQDHTNLLKGVDFIINTISQNSNSILERFRISSDMITYITGNLDTGLINNVNLTDFVAITESSISDLDFEIIRIDSKIQNISATDILNKIDRSSQFKLNSNDRFSITSEGVNLQSLYFSVRQSSILSQISHIFSNGILPFTNLIGDIGSQLLKFNNLYVDSINGLSSCGGKYNKTGDDITITNTTSKVSMLNSGVGNLLWGSRSVRLGDSYHIRVSGTIETDGKSNSILFEIKLDTRIIHSSDFIDLEDVKSSFPFEIEVDFTFYSNNSNADINASSQFVYVKNTGSDDFRGSTSNTQSTINAFRDNTLTATAQWNNQSTTNVLIVKQFTISKTF